MDRERPRWWTTRPGTAPIDGQRCTVEMGVIPGDPCNRKAVMEITQQGRHVAWRCKLHSAEWEDDAGNLHDSVKDGWNMIPGILPKGEGDE